MCHGNGRAHSGSPAFLRGSASLSGPPHSLGVGGWELMQWKWKCCNVNRRKPRQSCDGIKWGFRVGLGHSKGTSALRQGRLAVSIWPPGSWLHGWRCARYHACGAPLSRAPGGPSRKATVGCKWQAWFQADSLHLGGTAGRELAASLAPPFAAVAQQRLQSPALQSTDGVCSTLPHLPAYLSTALYLRLLISFVLF